MLIQSIEPSAHRAILHSDANCFYASVEMLYEPKLRNVPMIVGGNPETRHGIVLAKNDLAKAYGIKTAETLRDAFGKCPRLVCRAPRYDLYMRFSKELFALYNDYTDKVQPFGMDEGWMDVTGSRIMGDGEKIADEIRMRTKKEIGLTLSIGVSWNKIYAKLGSDMKKPDATTTISLNNYKEKVWSLPAGELLYVGPSSQAKLANLGILTIGDIARMGPARMKACLGVNGLGLYDSAAGLDKSPVDVPDENDTSWMKSIGNSTTTPRDVCSFDDAKVTMYALSESVAARLREHGFSGRTVQVTIRGNDLRSYQRQKGLRESTQLSSEIAEAALELMAENHNFAVHPARSLGVRVSNLSIYGTNIQLSMLPDVVKRQKLHDIECALDGIRARYGYHSVRRGLMLEVPDLDLDAKNNLNPFESF